MIIKWLFSLCVLMSCLYILLMFICLSTKKILLNVFLIEHFFQTLKKTVMTRHKYWSRPQNLTPHLLCVCSRSSRGLLFKHCVCSVSDLGLLAVCSWSSLYALKCEADLFLPPVDPRLVYSCMLPCIFYTHLNIRCNFTSAIVH